MSFINFVNRVLLLNDVSDIKKFRLGCATYFKAFVNTWICTAIKRNVQELDVYLYLEQPVNVPHLLFTCETLVVLTLSCEIGLDIPASVWLPSLKILHLWLVKYMNDETTQKKLFCGCPVLEEFVIRTQQDRQWDFNVSSPTLISLTIFVDEFMHIDESDDPEYKLVVNAPNLQYLNLNDFGSNDYLVENLSSLVKAKINVGRIGTKGSIYKLLSQISNVKFLSLSCRTLSSLSDIDGGFNLPTFNNVTGLKLGDLGWKLLTDFLESAPNLEILILKKDDPRNTGPDEHWTSPLRVPNCLVWHLKEIEIEVFLGKQCELEAIEYMLKNAKFLKKMAINCQDLDLEEKSRVCKKLSSFPRGSRRFQLSILV